MDPTWDVPCPGCKRKVKIKLSQMAANKSVRCPSGHTINLTGDDAKQAKKALDDLERTLKRYGK